jgi:uncharacterized OsmC-like protein
MPGSDKVVYHSRVRIERQRGPMRLAWLPAEKEPVVFGLHSAVAEHYKVPPDAFPPRATTLDYVVAAAAGWLTGTLGAALEARQIDASGGKFSSEAVGEIELDGGVLVIRRIRVHYKLQAPETARETVERLHGVHADKCPVARSLSPGIDIQTSYELVTGW